MRLTESSLVLCSGTLGSVSVVDKAVAAAGAGFDGISLYAREYEQALPCVLDDLGLAIAEVDGPTAWLRGNEGPEPADVVDLAASLGARSVTVIETSGADVDRAEAAEAFGRVCDLARDADPELLVHIEPFPFSGIRSLVVADEIVALAGRPNGGTLLDTWHLVRGDDRGEFSPSIDGERVVGLQINAAAPVPASDVRAECMGHRLMPDRHTAVVVEELRRRGCRAPLELEVFSTELSGLEPETIARRAMAAVRGLVPSPDGAR